MPESLLRKLIPDHKGQLALLALIVIAEITLIVSVSASLIGRNSITQDFRFNQTHKALAAAESCIDEGLKRLKDDASFMESSITIEPDTECAVTVFSDNAADSTLYVTGMSGVAVRKLIVRITRSGGSLSITDYKESVASAWHQTNWTGNGSPADYASHFAGNQNDWKSYSSKDPQISNSPDTDLIISSGVTGQYSLISSPFDSNDAVNKINQIRWNENTPLGTEVKFQIRTSPDNSTWTSYMGPAGTGGAADVFSATASGCSKSNTSVTCQIPDTIVIGDGSSDRWFQYQVYLSTADNAFTPTLHNIRISYKLSDEQ